MNAHKVSSTILKDESGQMLPMVAIMLVVMMGFAGLVIDVGRAYVGYRQLQAATDAAALAASQYLPDNTAASTAANSYGGATGSKNPVSILSNVGMVTGYPLYKCFTSLGLACIAPANANGVIVKQTGTVNMTFGALVGFKKMTLVATSTAAMRGSVAGPYNVAIVIDTTASMGNNDNSSTCNDTRLNCALHGVQVLLQGLNPCAASGCGTLTGSNVANPVDKVAIFTYPNVTAATVSADYDCTGSNPTTAAYTFPSSAVGVNGYSPAGATYQIVGYSSDYKSSNAATTLSTSSNISAAIGAGPTTTVTKKGKTTTTPCTGMQAPGGQGTFFAGTIYAAQASLVAAQTANPKAQNVMVILSDGDASASGSAMSGASTSSGVYPSTKNQCAQAVTAAAAAKTAGTKVYTVAYGALSSGCSTDSPSISPCKTMENMAYDASTFYSDYTATGGSNTCISAAQPTTSLDQIFTAIAGDLTLSRLIPDNTP